MKELRISVKDKIATLVNDVELVCGNSDYRVIFEFDEDWAKYNAKTALFVFGDTTVEVPFTGNIITEKDAVAIEKATKCYIGVFTGDLITTTKAEIKCLASIRDIAKTPKPPKEDVYNKIIELINSIKLSGSAIIDVEELPTEDINTALFYRTPDGTYWFDGEWHEIADESKLEDLARHIEETIIPQIVNADYDVNEPTSKAYIENRPFFDTRSTDENGEETGELKTLEDKYLDLENRAKFKEVESIAKGAGQAVSYGNYSTMITALNSLPSDVYKVGQSIMIVTVEVPDLWVSAIGEESTEYTYTSDEDFVSTIKANGSVKVGHYQLSQLETQKVDLQDYVKYSDEPGNAMSGGKPGPIALNYATSCGLRIEGTAGKRYLMVYGGNDTDVLRRNGACVVTLANMDSRVRAVIAGEREKKVNDSWEKTYGNQIDLGEEGRASAQKWLGLPYMGTEVEAEYSCKSYPHYATISGWLDDRFGFATDEVLSVDDLDRYEIIAEFENADTRITEVHALSLEGAEVISLTGGYALQIYGKNDCPPARVIVITDVNTFNHNCSCAFESNGTYLARTQQDNVSNSGTHFSTVKTLRKYPWKYLNLADNAVIKALMARIEALENK